jgi:hypothetical protein
MLWHFTMMTAVVVMVIMMIAHSPILDSFCFSFIFDKQ